MKKFLSNGVELHRSTGPALNHWLRDQGRGDEIQYIRYITDRQLECLGLANVETYIVDAYIGVIWCFEDLPEWDNE